MVVGCLKRATGANWPGYDAGVVRYREIAPSPRLRPIVRSFWLLEHDGRDSAPQRVAPDGHSELILNWRNPFEARQGSGWIWQPRCFFAGQLAGPLLLRPGGPAKMLGVSFHPHGAAAIFPHPMQELGGLFTPLEDLAPDLARLLDRALDSPATVAAVEAALIAAADQLDRRRDRLIEEAVRRMVHPGGASNLATLARDLGLSHRQLERRFQTAVGLPPKIFCRIQRFTGVFRALEEQPRSWAKTAIACGYYDQAHLIRDCKAFSGQTPAVLMAEEADLARHFYQRFGVSHLSNTITGGLL